MVRGNKFKPKSSVAQAEEGTKPAAQQAVQGLQAGRRPAELATQSEDLSALHASSSQQAVGRKSSDIIGKRKRSKHVQVALDPDRLQQLPSPDQLPQKPSATATQGRSQGLSADQAAVHSRKRPYVGVKASHAAAASTSSLVTGKDQHPAGAHNRRKRHKPAEEGDSSGNRPTPDIPTVKTVTTAPKKGMLLLLHHAFVAFALLCQSELAFGLAFKWPTAAHDICQLHAQPVTVATGLLAQSGSALQAACFSCT